MTSLGILVKEGADDMDISPMGLLAPGFILVTTLVCLTLTGEKLRDRFAG
jgi:oligopeptide transport system permease protein